METFFEITTRYDRDTEVRELDFSNKKKVTPSKSPVKINDSMSNDQISDIVSSRLVQVIEKQLNV